MTATLSNPLLDSAPDAASGPVIKCAALTKVFRDFWMRPRVRAVDHIDLDIHRGEVFGLLGPNGSGKSTTIKMILGLLYPTSGRIGVFGKRPEDVSIKNRIGYLPEESYLYRFLSARETLDYYGRLFHQDATQRRHRIDTLLQMVGLEAVQNRPVGEYSKGMQRRIGLAQALINDPDLLILDEPTTGMDPLGSRQIKDLILKLAQPRNGKPGKTVLLCSHQLVDVEDVCHRVAIMFGGKIRALGTCDELLVRQELTTIQTEALDVQTIQAIEELLESRGKHIERVERPRQNLESLFLQIVHQAHAEGLATSGASAGGQIADFLMDGAPGNAADTTAGVVDQLITPKAPASAAPVPAPVAQPDAAQDVLQELTQTRTRPTAKPAPTAPPPPSEEAPDADFLKSLLNQSGGDKNPPDPSSGSKDAKTGEKLSVADKTVTIPDADPNLVPGLRTGTSSSWRVWGIIMASLVVATALLGFLLRAQSHPLGAAIAIAIGVFLSALWLGWGAWTWRHVVIVRRAGKLYLVTFALIVFVALLALLVPGGHITPSFWRQIAISLAGFWGMTLTFIIGLWLIRLVLSPAIPALGVARTLVNEAIRMKIALIFIVCLAIIVPFLPLILDPKERLQYRVQFFMYWTLAGTGFLLSLMTLFLACGTICDEIKHRQIFLTMSKPVSRFQYLLGKWLGIVLLDLLLVTVAGLGIYAGVQWLNEQPARGMADRYALNTEVLVARQGVTPTTPDNLDSQEIYQKRLQNMRAEAQQDPKLVRTGPPTAAEDQEVRSWLSANWYAIKPGETTEYVFHNLGAAKAFPNNLQLRVKATASRDPPDHKLYLGMMLNDRVWVDANGRPVPVPIHSNQYDIIEIPSNIIADNGDLKIRIANPMQVTLDFQAGNGLEILYRTDSFLPNFVRGLAIVWFKLIFLAMLGLTAGTFLGFPVASLLGLVIFVLADFSGFISESLSTFAAGSIVKGDNGIGNALSSIWAHIIRGDISNTLALVIAVTDKVMMAVFSAFGSFDPVGLVVDGRVISGHVVLSAVFWLILIWTLLCGLVGVLIFYRRELAKVTI